MKKYGIKRMIILLLCVCITGTSIPIFAKEQKDSYEQRVIERFWESFEVNDGEYYENLVNTKEYSYVRWADVLKGKNNLEKAFLWATNFLLDKKMNTEAYVNYLTTILSMMDVGMEDSILEQATYTAEKNVSDFASETYQMGLEKFLGITTYSKLNDTFKIFFDVKEIADLGSDTITDTTQLYVYSVASASYEKKRIFLEELNAYTKDKKLKKATEQMLKVIDLEFAYIMLNYTDDFLFDAVDFGMDVSGVSWVEDVNPAICKMVSENLAPWLAEHGKTKLAEGTLVLADAVKKYGAKVGLFVKTMLLTGKAAALVVGDDVEMYRELQVMDAMSDALSVALLDYNNKVAQSNNIQKKYENVHKYVVIGEALSYIHTRGEYCVSEIRKKQGESPAASEKEYFEIAEKLQEAYEILAKILPDPEQYVVTEGFELTNGFIVEVIQRNYVPDGYIGIYDFSDLMAMRDNPNQNYILMNDIQCGAYELKNVVFMGILDGNGYRISNMSNPLFGVIREGMVKNLGMEVCAAIDYIDRKEGALYGALGSGYWGTLACVTEDAVINNCYVEGSVYITEEEGERIKAYVGGFVGLVRQLGESSTNPMVNCYNKANITFEYGIGTVNLGGLAGEFNDYGSNLLHTQSSEYLKFENCFNEGNLKVNADAKYDSTICVGGICGESNVLDYVRCYNSGDIKINAIQSSRTDLIAGGIAGVASGGVALDGYKKGVFSSCWNVGTITSQSDRKILETNTEGVYYVDSYYGVIAAGGLVGSCGGMEIRQCFNNGEIDGRLYSGGLAGIFSGLGKEEHLPEENVWIRDSYNTGKIKGNYLAGGIVGISDNIFYLKNCYTTGEVTKGAVLGGQFAGYLTLDATYENCFYVPKGRSNMSGTIERSNEIKSVSEAEMQQKDTYTGFDFGTIWKYEEENVMAPVKLRF